ncbi:MAG: sigma-70 family RNA polymerase sigma factor [Chitinophagaceae bacterium]
MGTVNLLDENLMLWDRFRNGDSWAFSELMRLHYNDLYNYGSRFTKETELVKDCIQDLFLSLWKNRATINSTSFVKYYLLKSLRRMLKRAVGKKKYLLMPKEFAFENFFNAVPSAENAMIELENISALARSVRKMLSNLSKRQQEVIYLRFYMDADVEEIAEITSLNRQSVYNLLHDGMKKLKKIAAQKDFQLSDLLSFKALFL